MRVGQKRKKGDGRRRSHGEIITERGEEKEIWVRKGKKTSG